MTRPLHIGFIPLIDAAALIIAVDKGFAAAEGLDVTLVREVSWSNVRDKLNIGLFDAAHLLAPVAIASSLGLGHIKVPIVAPFNLGLNGNAITVSPALDAAITAEIFRRPSSVRRITSASTPTYSGRAIMRATSVRFCGCSMNSAAREAARTRAATCSGFFSAQLWRIASTFSAARTRMSETKCRIWPTPRSTAIEFHGAPTQNPSIWPLARLSTM